MQPIVRIQNRFNMTSMGRLTFAKQYRKSIGVLNAATLSKIDTGLQDSKNTTQGIISRRTSLGKTQKIISFKNNRFTLNQKTKTIKNIISITDKVTYFDIYSSDLNLIKQYKLISHIGKGCFSTVSLAIHKETKINYAIKTYQKIDGLEQYRLDGIKRQIKNLKNLNHENVISLIHVFRDKKKLLLLMDNGGKQSLSGILRKYKSFNQNTAKYYFKQILAAVSYCHQNNVCHRDLKPENILVDDQGHLKLIDFGFSGNTKTKLKIYCGTPPFMCPELMKKIPYSGAAADVWAMGIMLYQLIIGTLPFRATNQAELGRLIQQGKYPNKDKFSKNLKCFLDRMLTCDPQKRSTAKQLLDDVWLR